MATTPPKKAAALSRACANCGALEDLPDTTLMSCARCHLVSYCSRAYQAQHLKQKPAGHTSDFALRPRSGGRWPLSPIKAQMAMSV